MYLRTVNETQDYVVKALCLNGKVRIYAARTTQLANECQRRHNMWPVASAAVGRTLSVGAMMGAMLKGEEQLTLQVRGGGPLGQIVVDANGKGEVRGFVEHPQTHFPLTENGKLDVGQGVGTTGNIYVTKNLGMKQPYEGSSGMVSGEIGEDFTYYFAQSEQIPSAVAVGVMVNPDNTVKASGGYIIQLMPGVEEPFISDLENRLKSVPAVSHMIDQGDSPEQMVEHIFKEHDINWIGSTPLTFTCRCSTERVKNTLSSLGQEELSNIITEQGQAEVHCHFCYEKYVIEREELIDLLEDMKDK